MHLKTKEKEMATTWNTTKRARSWYKFLITVVLGALLLLANNWVKSNYLQTGAVVIFVISIWYGIIAVLQMLEKISNS